MRGALTHNGSSRDLRSGSHSYEPSALVLRYPAITCYELRQSTEISWEAEGNWASIYLCCLLGPNLTAAVIQARWPIQGWKSQFVWNSQTPTIRKYLLLDKFERGEIFNMSSGVPFFPQGDGHLPLTNQHNHPPQPGKPDHLNRTTNCILCVFGKTNNKLFYGGYQ